MSFLLISGGIARWIDSRLAKVVGPRLFISLVAWLYHGQLFIRGLYTPLDGGAISDHSKIRASSIRGIGCQFGANVSSNDIECSEHTFPSVGAGISYMVKEETSVLIRLEIAKGKNDNEALYLRFGHAF